VLFNQIFVILYLLGLYGLSAQSGPAGKAFTVVAEMLPHVFTGPQLSLELNHAM
jgi:hypothetical protein